MQSMQKSENDKKAIDSSPMPKIALTGTDFDGMTTPSTPVSLLSSANVKLSCPNVDIQRRESKLSRRKRDADGGLTIGSAAISLMVPLLVEENEEQETRGENYGRCPLDFSQERRPSYYSDVSSTGFRGTMTFISPHFPLIASFTGTDNVLITKEERNDERKSLSPRSEEILSTRTDSLKKPLHDALEDSIWSGSRTSAFQPFHRDLSNLSLS
mmetsp:Transcript_2637/g.3671  ORF Transcript_2637/g.3671 Transcript_2637/m.3671 type:complete len:213 (+) Transcript_2637:68-706(+)